MYTSEKNENNAIPKDAPAPNADNADPLEESGEKIADTSEGNLPDPDTLSNNEDGEYDRLRIDEK